MLEYFINGKVIHLKTNLFTGKQNIDFYVKKIYNTFAKIGIEKNFIDIEINHESGSVKVFWQINEKSFFFQSLNQQSAQENCGVLAIALEEDVRQIKRGIKGIDMLMKQYECTTPTKTKRITSINDFTKKDEQNNINFETFNLNDLSIEKPVLEKLDKKYYYLRKEGNEKLDILYIKFKEECIKLNTPNHPLLKALKIIRTERGLKL